MTKTRKSFYTIYAVGFLWALAAGLPSFIQTSFLEQYIGINWISFFIAIANILGVIAILSYPKFIKRFSNHLIALAVLAIISASIVFLIQASDLWILLLLYIVQFVGVSLFSINMDIFLENVSNDKNTGAIRTGYMTVTNVAWVIAPLAMGYLVSKFSYSMVYFVSALLFLPAFVILLVEKNAVAVEKTYINKSLRKIWQSIRGNKNLRAVFKLEFVLKSFFAFMVLYVPIYLNQVVGFDWDILGLMFTLMLTPFVLLQLPAGRIADKYLGEKELSVAGLVIMALSCFAIFFTTSTSVVVWTVILIVSRIGAALLNAMIETYFFKQISVEDVDIIDNFRAIRPFAWLCTAAISFIVLTVFSIQYLFLLLGLVLLLALKPAFSFEDTK